VRRVAAQGLLGELGYRPGGSAITWARTAGYCSMTSTVAVIASRVVSKPATRAAPRIMLWM
jgi:hypothetical protein